MFLEIKKSTLVFISFLLCNCIFFFFGSGCKNDLDILAPYKDTTIVYGVLNAADTAQYIRIHKAYLGEGNAYEMAQYTDSFYYKSNLKVVLEEYNKGIKVNEIICEKDSNVIKEPGIFASSPNILFKTTGNDSLNEKSSYKLIIRNTETGKLITSTTNVLGKLLIEKPNNSPANFLDDPYELKWFTILNAQAYEVVIRFHYFEQKKNNPLDIEAKYFDWKAAYEEHPDNDPLHEIKVTLQKLEFFRVAAANIKADTSLKRIAGNVEFIFIAGSKDLLTYYKINNFTTNLAQVIPVYTNIDGGLGIFTSRRKQILQRAIDTATILELKNGEFTKDLGF